MNKTHRVGTVVTAASLCLDVRTARMLTEYVDVFKVPAVVPSHVHCTTASGLFTHTQLLSVDARLQSQFLCILEHLC